MKKILAIFTSIISILALNVIPAYAHSVVKPGQVGIAATLDFTVYEPSEKDASTTSIKLMLPPGLNFVTPVVQSGWTATLKTNPFPSGVTPPVSDDGDVADSIPTEIDWTGGAIPSSQQGIFTFTAQAPATPGELDWKIYQGYSDGSTVSWDLGPKDQQPKDEKGNPTYDEKGPYSKTMVINDLTKSGSGNVNNSTVPNKSNNQTLLVWVALVLSVVSLGMQLAKRK